MEFQILPIRGEKIPEGYSLATVAQAQAQLQSARDACSSSAALEKGVRLKNGLLLGRAAKKSYQSELEYKLVISKPESGTTIEAALTKEDCLIALAYAAEHNDVDEEVDELVEHVGPNILKKKMPFFHMGTILHVCTTWGSNDTLVKVLNKYPESVNVYSLDRDGDTALHNLPNYETRYEVSKEAACHLLRRAGNVNKLLSVQNNYGGMTAVCKALLYHKDEVCRAILKAGQEEIERERREERAADYQAPDWITFKTHEEYSTALHLAVISQKIDIVNEILAYPGIEGLNLASQLDRNDNTPLHFAAALGDLQICLKLLQYMSADIKVDGVSATVIQNKLGETPLHLASTMGHAEVCATLVEYGDSIHLKDNDGRCALTNAFSGGHKQVVRRLLDAWLHGETVRSGPQTTLINAKLKFGLTPLHLAVDISSSDHIAALLRAGAFADVRNDDGKTPLHMATQKYNSSCTFFQILSDRRHEWKFSNDRMNLGNWINMKDSSGQTALHNMVRLGGHFAKGSESEEIETQVIDEVRNEEIESEVTVESEVRDGETKRKVDDEEIESEYEFNIDDFHKMVKELLDQGALVDLKDCYGETPLHIAARECHKETVSILLTKGCHYSPGSNREKWIAMCDFSGETALHEAAKECRTEIVKLLLQAAAGSLNDLLRVRDIESRTALHWAVKNGDKTTTEEIMRSSPRGADGITKSFLMWNVKEHTDPGDHHRLCKMYDVKEDQTSLMCEAVKMRDVDIAREIINRGADVTSLDYNSRRWLSQNLRRKASDQPTPEDSLDRTRLVEGVAALLLNPYTETPISIGIFGAWGTGKSSFMIQVEEALFNMAVKETFKNTSSPTQSHDEESSMLKFSSSGAALRAKVVKALDKCQSHDEESSMLKFSSSGVALRAKVVKDLEKCMPDSDIENQRRKEVDVINNFPIKLQSEYRQLFKDLTLTDRSKMVQSHGKRKVGKNNQTLQDEQLAVTGHTPAVLTVRYNAWQYDNKTEASAGLAVEISQQLENFMTPDQWLRMCWKYSWKSRPMEIFVQLLLPVLLAFVAVCAVVVLWKVAPITTKYKVLSLPVGILGVIWVLFKALLQVIQPVTQTILSNMKSPDHQSMLGYQHTVIGDIKFLKDELCKKAHFGWKILGFLGQFFISNSYFMEGTWIWKQHPRLNNLRIVVFIDDLDRCDEKTVLELLRAVNLILGSCGISVVMGIDKGMVHRAITKEFLKDTGDKLLNILIENTDKKALQEDKRSLQVVENDKKAVQEDKSSGVEENDNKSTVESSYTYELADKYMQKIIQLPIQLPDPSTKVLQQFLGGQVGRRLTGFRKGVGDKKNEEDGAFRLLVANYSPMESDMLIKLCASATAERKFPREWKRFLNYHRLAWMILSQDPKLKNKEYLKKKELKGWQRKLVLWIFVCWNWREQMDVIIENWQDLLSKKQDDMHWQEKNKNDGASLALGDVIGLYMESKGWKTKRDSDNITRKQADGQVKKAWFDLHNTLREEYDIPMRFIKIFQQFRFYCKLNHLQTDYKKNVTHPKSQILEVHPKSLILEETEDETEEDELSENI